MPILNLRPEWLIGNPPEVESTGLSRGRQGNLETVAKMQEVARARAGHPKIRALAVAILNQARTRSMAYADEAKAIGRYVQRSVPYVQDPIGNEMLTDPLLMIEQIQGGHGCRGDCDDMSLLIATLLLAIGHTPYFRVVRYKGHSGPYQHIYVVDYCRNPRETKDSRVVLDAIIKSRAIGFEVPHASGDEIPA